MATRYRIIATSVSTSQRQQQMDLTNDPQLGNSMYAQQMAVGFASRLNAQFHMHACDWQGNIEAYEHRD